MRIKVTNDREMLERIWGYNYAMDNRGKIYDAEIDRKGWAVTDKASFPPGAFEVIEE